MSDRYHKAARDGLCEVLKEATKKEINSKDNDGMTPVLWAAFEGKIDALRLMIGRGGDPDKTDQFGNSALHLASAKGHFSCVDFLVKFGANIYALDIDNHNPQQLAAINNRDEILHYLDNAAGHLEASDPKKVKNLKEKAKKQSEKRIKEFMKRQQKKEEESEKTNVLKAMKYKFFSGSSGNLSRIKDSNLFNQDNKFSVLVGNGTIVQRGAAQRKIQALKHVRQANTSEIKETLRNVETNRKESDVIYVGTLQNSNIERRGRIADIFNFESGSVDGEHRMPSMSRCLSQPNLLSSNSPDLTDDISNQKTAGLFERPVIGTLSIPHSITSANSSVDQISNPSSESSSTKTNTASKKTRQRQLIISDSEESDASQNSSDECEEPHQALKRFLAAYSLEEHLELLLKHQIDLDTLMILTEEDLKYLNLPLGPYRRLAVAIQERKNALNNPGAILDSRL